MRKILPLFLIVTTYVSFSQQSLYWGPESMVADGSVYGNLRPRITLDGNENPIIVTGKSSTGALYSIRWNGTAFDVPLALLPDGMEAYIGSWNGPDIAALNDTVIIVFKANPIDSGNVYIVRSTDGGINYSDTIRADSHNNGVAWLPSMDIDQFGNPHITYMVHDPNWSHPRYVVSHSTDAGLSFAPEQDIAYAIANEACDCCPAEYIVEGNLHALLYRNNENNIRNIYTVFSSDGGNSYPSYLDVDSTNWYITSCPSTGPHGVFNNQKLITVFASGATDDYRIYISETATQPALAFENTTMMTPPVSSSGIQNYPRISGKNDTLVMVWQESDGSAANIYCSYTTTGSISELLANKQIVNSVLTGTQSNPDVIYKNGFIHLAFQDSYSGDVIYKRGSISAVGINELTNGAIRVYPNPADNYLNIAMNEDVNPLSICLNDASGRTVLSIAPEMKKIEIPNHLEGIYFLNVNYSDGSSSKVKLILR